MPYRAVRYELLEELVLDIQTQPFQPMYRGKVVGREVIGWPNRLEGYFWPKPVVSYRATASLLAPLFEEAGGLSNLLVDGRAWSLDERARATELASAILKWGGVKRPQEFSPDVVERVFRRSLGISKDWAPMSSGWSKVAAMATAFREGASGPAPHAIWDSRVSSSLVRRLDKKLSQRGLEPKTLFPRIGAIAGRGGSRAGGISMNLKWAHAYGSWNAQFAGSELVREIRDTLNSVGPRMPLSEGGSGPWTIRGVESVLFMDGY